MDSISWVVNSSCRVWLDDSEARVGGLRFCPLFVCGLTIAVSIFFSIISYITAICYSGFHFPHFREYVHLSFRTVVGAIARIVGLLECKAVRQQSSAAFSALAREVSIPADFVEQVGVRFLVRKIWPMGFGLNMGDRCFIIQLRRGYSNQCTERPQDPSPQS